MEREEIERVERELDAILKLVQPEPTIQDKAREEALSKELVSGGEKMTSEEDEYGMEEENETAGQDRQQYDKRETGMLRTGNRRGLRLLKPSDGLVAAFFVPVVAMIIIFAQRGIFPFGEECFLRTDMYHQYAPFFSEFQYKLTHGGSLLYSWDIGMGVNFSALYAYYLASPVNWLLILCPKKFIIE